MLHNRLNGRTILAFFAMAVALLAATPAWAQTTGSIRVQVVDDDMGLPIPGVAITLSGDGMIGGAQERTSDNNGEALFVELLPGAYRVSATRAGFSTVTASNVQVLITRTTVQRIAMSVGQPTEEIDIIAKEKTIDVESTSRGQVLTKEMLQRVPTGRSYQSAVMLASGVTGGGGNPNMAGAATNENTYMLDGANITDPVTGTFSVNFNFDAIEQIQVMLGGYMPEYGTSVGGIVNLVTESGTNTLSFDSSIFYQNGDWRPKMDARYTREGLPLAPTGFDSTFQYLSVAGKVSGPIVRDKAWFIISYQHSRTLIANTGVRQPRDFDGHYVLGKLTIQPTTEHRFSAFVQLDPTSVDNAYQGDPFVRAEAQDRQVQGGLVGTARWQWFLSEKVNLDTMFVGQKSYIEAGAVPCTHDDRLGYNPCGPGQAEGSVDWFTPGRIGLGGAFASVNTLQSVFDDRYRYNASTKLSVVSIEDPLGGTHDLKFGIEGVQLVWDNLSSVNGNTIYYDWNRVGYDPTTFENYYWVEYGSATMFRTTGSQWNMFAQDSWKPVPNLTINYGSRFDSFVMRNDVGEPTLQGAMFGPRLFAAWDPFKDQKTKIAGGYGRFNDTGRLAVADFTSRGALGAKMFLGEFVTDGERGALNSQSLVYDQNPAINYNTAAEKIRNPRVDEVLLTVEREIIEDWMAFSSMSGKFTRNIHEPDENSLIFDSDGSAIVGSRIADPSQRRLRMRTPALAKRDYFQWDLGFRKIASKRWAMDATYTYTQSVGSSTGSNSGSFANAPQTRYNYGPLNTDLQHVVKAQGWWELPTDPWTGILGATFQYYSGRPLERLYFGEHSAGGSGDGGYFLRRDQRGVYTRFGNYWEIGVKYQQAIDVRKGQLLVDLEASNLFNARAPDIPYTTLYSENRLLTAARQNPLRLQAGIRYKF